MASSQNAITEHLQCSVCLDRLNDPHLLPCQHTFCLACLQALVAQSPRPHRVTCPACRQETHLPQPAGVQAIPKNLLANQLIDTLSQSKQATAKKCEECDEENDAAGFCEDCQMYLCEGCVRIHVRSKTRRGHAIVPMAAVQDDQSEHPAAARELECDNLRHRGERLEVYCITCDKAICYKCAAVQHQNCKKGDLDSACEAKKADANLLIGEVEREVIAPLRTIIRQAEQGQRCVLSSSEKAEQDINDFFSDCQELLDRRKRDLVKEVKGHSQFQQDVLVQRARRATADLHRALQCTAATTNTMTSRKRSVVVNSAAESMAQLEDLKKTASEVRPEDMWAPKETVFSAQMDNFASPIKNLGAVRSNIVSGIKLDRNPPSDVLRDTPFEVRLTQPAGFQARLQVDPPLCAAMPNLSVVRHASQGGEVFDTFKITTKAAGKHKVHIRVGGNDQEGTVVNEFSMNSHQIPDQGNVSGQRGIRDGQFNSPLGITAYHGNHFLVADKENKRLQEVNDEGHFVRSIPAKAEITAVTTLPSGNILATDMSNHQVHMFSQEGQLISSFGSHGDQPGQFDRPYGVAITNNGHVVVSDMYNNRLQVVDPNRPSTPLVVFSKCGHDRILKSPRGVLVDPSSGNIAVANDEGHSIEVFSSDGHHITKIGTSKAGSGPGQLSGPTGLALHQSNHFLVADFDNKRVCIFTRDGQFVDVWGKKQDMGRPWDVACSPSGRVMVTEYDKYCLHLL